MPPAKRTTAAKRTTSASRAKSTAKPKTTARSKTAGSSARAKKASTASSDARLDAVAQRLRKLNEQIIEAGKEAGESTLTTYEKALKAIASTIEKGPGSSEIDWISSLATAQAKFLRDVTAAWTSAARKALK
jgi:hypothetical protein